MTNKTDRPSDKDATLTEFYALVNDGLASGVSTLTMDEIIAEARMKVEADWLAENKSAIVAYNKRIDEQGPLIKPIWLKKS